MPEFQKKTTRFQHQGMQFNTAIDTIPEGQIAYGRNVRVYQQTTITSRPGITDYHLLPGTYGHSISRLNNFDPNINFSFGYVIGVDNSLYFGACQFTYPDLGTANAHIKIALTSSAQNPLRLPPNGSTAALSGNPLTMVDMAPLGSNSGWKYIGDKNLNCAVGLYPGDDPAINMARCNTMGLRPPPFNPFLSVSPGLLSGTYQWMVAYRNKWTGAMSNPSAPSREDYSATPGKVLADEQVSFTLPTSPMNPQTGAPDPNIVVDVYRTGGTQNIWHYVGSADGGTVFTDNLPDSAVITAPTPPQVVDPTTGVVRFIKYQPFVTQDIARYNSPGYPGTISLSLHGTYLLNTSGPDTFNMGILPGSAISINNKIFTVYQVNAPTQLEITEDATGTLTNGQYVPWAVQAGTLVAGAPLPHIWGPYGIGESGAYIFGCGDPNNAGTLFWTNGNDPDSTDLVNSLIVTSPSEPLRGGCVYDGTPFVWSTERFFRIYPGSVAGQFTCQEIPGGKGMWAEYSLTVQSNGVSDQSVTWVGKDGLYDWSTSGGLRTLTDRDLYPFFPHDNQHGVDLLNIFPFVLEPVPVGAPFFDPSTMKYHRLTWFQGELFYDYPDGAGRYHTLVYDGKQVNGWVSLDQYQGGFGTISGKPVARCNEIAANNLKMLLGAEILDYFGNTDSGNTIECRLVTRADNLGDSRTLKLYGDCMVDLYLDSGATVDCTLFLDEFTNEQNSVSLSNPSRTENLINLAGIGALGRSFGLDFQWLATGGVTLYQYVYSYVPKPELINTRATDKTDDGFHGAKYLRGLSIECNTFGARTVEVLVDDVQVGIITVDSGNSQREIPFALVPVVGCEFQVQATDAHNWEVFTIRWVWDKYPDLTSLESSWMDLGTSKAKYVRGFVIPLSGTTAAVGFTLTYDGANTVSPTAVTPFGSVAKTSAQYSIYHTILAHELKLKPTTIVRSFYDEIKWDAEEWPELAKLYGPWEDLGTSEVKYLRGFTLPMETNGQPVVMQLRYDVENSTNTVGTGQSQNFTAVSTDPLVKCAFPFTPVAPVLAHEFQLISTSPARFFYGEVKWAFEVWPEFSGGMDAWKDGGDPGAKFLQGAVIPMDTGGQAANMIFHYTDDAGVDHDVAMGPFTTPAGEKTALPYSFPTPLIVHEFQVRRNQNCRIWDDEIKWIWEPMPELVTTYTTQPTDHDLPGYNYLFDAYIAYIGSGDSPTFTVTTEYGSLTYNLPVANGTFNRAYLLLQPQKSKWKSYSIKSTMGIRLFIKDCEVRVKNWTDKGNYPSSFTSHMPFGEVSRISGARI